ncbi:MAG: NADH-quinone oxidoreductase subunit NuoG [Chloroflexota bacterium]
MSENLVTISVDGVEVAVPKETLVVDAAKQIQNNIPVFCYHPKMSPVGMCRMCLVEIGRPMFDRGSGEPVLNEDGTQKYNYGRGLETACTVQVSPGMVVNTTTEEVDDAREGVIEFLLTSHPLDCPICDKGGECPLQNLTMEHGKGETRMDFSAKKKMDKHVPLGDLIWLDRERCIQCARCTRFQDEVVNDPVIHFHNRGRSLEIVTFSDPGFDSYWSGNTTDICPVGALTTSDFRFGARPWEMIPVASLSPHSPAGSNLTFSTRREAKSGGRSVIKRVMPRQNESVNELWISDRDRFVHHYADSPNRLKAPLIRRNGKLTEASWDEAISFVAEKLETNKSSIAGLSGDRMSNEDLYMFQKLMRKGLGSKNIDLANRRLAGGDVVANVGIASGSNLKDLGAGDAILVVASDLHEEVPVWWLRVKQAAERGASLVVLNLRHTRLDPFAACTIHYSSGDAVSTVQNIVNAAKVKSDKKEATVAAANMLMEAKNLVAFYGSEGLSYDETAVIAGLLANLLLIKDGDEAHAGRQNNGLIPVWPHNNTQGAWDMGIHPAFEPGYKAIEEAGMSASEIYASVENGNLSALYVMGADPMGDGQLTQRDQLDFMVVQELFMTETAAAADVVLPAQSWAEREGTFTSGERRIQRYYQGIQPLGDAKPDWQILSLIGEKLGTGKPAFAASLLFNELAKAIPQYKGINYRTLAHTEVQWPDVSRDDLYYGGTSYENRAGLGQQWSSAAESGEVAQYEMDVDLLSEDGLKIVRTAALYTPGSLNQHSEMLAPRIAEAVLSLNESDADGVSDGDSVSVTVNGRSYEATAHVNGYAPSGLAFLRGVPYFAGTAVVESIDKIS